MSMFARPTEMTFRIGLVGLLLPVLLAYSGHAQSSPVWKYDFRSGDHLTYRETVERTTEGEGSEASTRATFTTHVLILGDRNSVFSVGFQRNRDSAELLLYREKGKDKLQQQLPGFNARLAKRPVQFAEANEFSASGAPQHFWEAARESSSKLLLAVHEIEALPQKPLAVGESWPSMNLLGFEFRFVAMETLDEESCHRFEGENSARRATMRWWWCAGSGVTRKLEFDGEYGVPGGAAREKIAFQLRGRQREEKITNWLESGDTRQAVLKALLLSPWVPLEAESLQRQLSHQDPPTQELALALLYRRRMILQDRSTLDSFLRGSDTALRRLASLLVNEPAKAMPIKVGNCTLSRGSRPTAETQKTGTTYRIVRAGISRGWPYAIRVPHDYRGDRPFPLLVYLSGGAGVAMDGVNTAEDAVASSDYLVLYPQAGGLWWEKDVTLHFADTLDEVLHTFNVDTDRIFIAGFSNGGTGAVYYAELWPHRFAAVVSLMGAGVCNERVGTLLTNARHLPILFVHGDKDPLIGAKCSNDTDEAFRNLAPDTLPQLHILKNREHDITLDTDDGLTLAFLPGKTRHPFPTSLSFRVAVPAFARDYWIEAVPKDKATATVDSKIQPDNTLKITTHDVEKLILYLRPDLFPNPGPVRIVVNKKEVFQGEIGSDCALLETSAEAAGDPQMAPADRKDFDLRK